MAAVSQTALLKTAEAAIFTMRDITEQQNAVAIIFSNHGREKNILACSLLANKALALSGK